MPELSDYDRDLATRTILAEGAISPTEQAAMANVIFNRIAAGTYGGTSMEDVVKNSGQFEPWRNEKNANYPLKYPPNTPDYQQASGIVDGVANGSIPDFTNGKTYFLQPEIVADRVKRGVMSWPAWARGQSDRIGAHAFYWDPKITNPGVPQGQPMAFQDQAGGDGDFPARLPGPVSADTIRSQLDQRRAARQQQAPGADDDATAVRAWLEQRRGARPPAPDMAPADTAQQPPLSPEETRRAIDKQIIQTAQRYAPLIGKAGLMGLPAAAVAARMATKPLEQLIRHPIATATGLYGTYLADKIMGDLSPETRAVIHRHLPPILGLLTGE